MRNNPDKNSIKIPYECKKIILLNALFQGGRLFVGAICALYFLSFGLQMEDYAWIKTVQAFVFVGLDIPLGYFLNRIGEYKSLVCALVLGTIGAVRYLIARSFLEFLLAEVFLALSISIWPVALSAYSMQLLEKYKTEGLTEKFFHLGDSISNIFILSCGALGGFFYSYNKFLPYSFFIIFYVLSILFTLFLLMDFNRETKIKQSVFKPINLNLVKQIFPFAIILFFIQFFMQPLFHYWQPLFQEMFSIESKDLSFVFVTYSISMSIMSLGYSKVTHQSSLRSLLFVLIAAVLAGFMYNRITEGNNIYLSVFFISMTFGIFNIIQVATGILVQNQLSQEYRMLVVKYVSFFARIGMIVSLVLVHYLFSFNFSTLEIYKTYSELSIFVFLSGTLYLIISKKVGRKYALESTG